MSLHDRLEVVFQMRRNLLMKLRKVMTKWGTIAQTNASSMRDRPLADKSAVRLGSSGASRGQLSFRQHAWRD